MERASLPGFAVVPRVGLVVVGGGTDRVRCSGDDCTAALDNDLGYSQLPGFALGVDLFGQLSPLWRLGGGLLVSPVSKADPDESAADLELGTLASALFIAELTPQVGKRSWLTPRVQLGPTLLFTSGELDDALEDAKSECEAAQTVDGCDSIDGTHVGFTLGVGFGGMFGVSEHVRLRVEGLVDFHAIPIMRLNSNVGDAEVSETLMQNRFLLLAGVEL